MERAVVNSLLVSGMVLLLQLPVFAAQSVTLAWNASTDPTVVGYNIYYGGASGNYTNTLSAGNATNSTVSGLVEGTAYYFAATTYNSSGVQSPFSNEVSYSVPTNTVTVNQPPTLNPINNLATKENAGLQTVNLYGITSGATNQNQMLTVSAISSNTNLIPNPTVNYTSPHTNGSLTFTPVINANGAAIVTVTVNNGGASNNIVTRTFTVTVNPVNQPPTLNPINNLAISENAGLQTVNLYGITSGAANENQFLTVTSTSSNTNLVPNPTIHYTSANTNGSLTFTPVTSTSGSTTISVTVNDGGTSNNIVTRSFTVTVRPVNQPPTLNPINNLVVNENAGLQTMNLYGITSGAANENQKLTVTATSSNTNLVPNPTVHYTSANTNGSVTFAPVTDSSGLTTISVTVNDGGTSNNIVTQTFTVTVSPVNQSPTLNPINNLVVNENAGLQTVNLYGISSGATNENQFLTVIATSSNTNLVPNPTVYYTSANTNGSLTFTPVTNATGLAIISATINDNGASNNIVTQTFSVSVQVSNDHTSPSDQITAPASNQQTTNGTFTVTGKASDNLAVGTVYYSLNGSGWTAATTADGWTNWTANLTLTPGYNTLQAYAVDTSGNISPTNSVRFAYLVPLPLTVNINGRGSVNPNYNGKFLDINMSYTMTASAISGSSFTNWTDGAGKVLTNRTTLQFTMLTNLTLTANFVDVQKPTLNILTPTSNQQWTNGTFTATGRASDNFAVDTVYYSLNGGTWTAAATADGWTNWTANVTLTPGYNTLQAYAVDTSGNISPTNSVRFAYLVPLPLTVNINGRGSVNPNYNGKFLDINMSYTMTASAISGSSFTNWTDGAGKVLTNRTTLQFTMLTNLTLTANFVDVQKPTLNILTPTSNQQWTNGTFTATGRASDNLAVGTVYYSLNGSGWTAATTANGWTNWTANVTLTPGYNTLQAYAVDTSGNISPTNSVRFAYLVPLPLTVNINGRGSVNPNYNGKFLDINMSYTMTASAQGGSMFTNWTDGAGKVLTNRTTLQFTMLTNLTLTANFVDVQKPTLNILTPTSNQQWTNGTFTATGRASDNFAVDTVYYSLNGGTWTAAATADGWTNWTANVTLTPGYNTLQAYAVDTSGNISPTNSVRFAYLVPLPLTVNINGRGSVNPNYNGKFLDINMSYTMTASAISGSSFTNWTDGAGKVLTNRTTLQFTMLTNLTLTANFVDVQKPTLNILTPTSNQQWTNGTFTATGRASDNLAVGTVYYSLNGSGWTAATTANGWTNWTANVTLTPGYNTLQAYAVDTSGNISPTNSVRFAYLVPLPLTVNINGRGSVNPNYNGKFLDINMSYTMTASAISGSSFTNWTDGAGKVLTNRTTLQFTMLTNLTLTANFVDVQKPTLNILTPTSNQQWTNGTFTATGRASDNLAVGTVYYSLNGSGWTPATTADGWTNWTANVTLTPGYNTLQAYAVDTSGNISPTNSVRFAYLVPLPLTVNINGRGSVNPNYNGKFLDINMSYTMTASAISGSSFTNWTDGAGKVLTNRTTLQFTMLTNLTLTANFVDVQKPTLNILTPTSNQQWINGTFTATGRASDNLAVGTVYYSLNGSGWTPATTADGWTNWTANLTLTPGYNTLQAYAVDTSGNISPTNSVRFTYNTAPNSLAGLMGAVSEDGGGTFYLCFGNGTFSQNSGNTNYDNGVGNYSYSKSSPNTAQLSITYTAPPDISGTRMAVLLTFTTNNECIFSNQSNAMNTGTISLWSAPNWALASVNGKTSALIADGQMTTAAFGSGTLTFTNAAGQTTNGNYTFKQYSPLGALLTVTQPNKTNFMQLTFGATNYGTYHSTVYNSSNNVPASDTGVFAMLSESLGGNAPASLAGTEALATQPDGLFEMNFGIAAFGQSSFTTNYANGVGAYTYSKSGADSATLSFNYTAPPTVAGSVGPLILTFIAPNFCVLTNQEADGSNSIAAISFWTPPTNWVPTSLAGQTLYTTNANGVADAVTLNGDGTFSQTETGSSNPGVSTGSYAFTLYGPLGGMLVLTYSGGAEAGCVSYIQTSFTGQGIGSFFVTFYDASADPPVTNSGNFTVQ